MTTIRNFNDEENDHFHEKKAGVYQNEVSTAANSTADLFYTTPAQINFDKDFTVFDVD